MCEKLRKEKQYHLLNPIQKYEHLSGGILEEFDVTPISLYLEDKGIKPVHARPYSVPRVV
jgi:hypothetical protein